MIQVGEKDIEALYYIDEEGVQKEVEEVWLGDEQVWPETQVIRIAGTNSSSVGASVYINGVYRSLSKTFDITLEYPWIYGRDVPEQMSTSAWFGSILQALTYTEGLNDFETLGGMFRGCKSLTEVVGISDWNTSKVRNVSQMFYDCSSLRTPLNLSRWIITDIPIFKDMFNGCLNLPELNISGWDTSKAESMQGMFSNCSVLTEIKGLYDLSTLALTNSAEMFKGCEKLTGEIKMPKKNNIPFDFIYGMFENCKMIERIDISNWDISKVTNLQKVFNNCLSLTEIIGIESWNTESVTNMAQLFASCRILSNLNNIVVGWKTSAVENMASVFFDCQATTELDLSGWNTEAVRDMSQMFSRCFSLFKIKGLLDFKTGNVGNMKEMFSWCYNLTSIADIIHWDVSKVVNMEGMFQNAFTQVDNTNLDLSKWNVSGVENMNQMFRDCKLDSLDISRWETNSVTDMSLMFYGANIKEVLGIENLATSTVTNLSQIFYNCRYLTNLDLSKWDISNATKMANMFAGGSCAIQTLNIAEWDFNGKSHSELFMNNRYITNIIGPVYNLGYDPYLNVASDLTVESILVLFNGLKTKTSKTNFTLDKAAYNRLSSQQIAIATGKGWTVVSS